MPIIINVSAQQQQQIRDAIDDVLQRLPGQITDEGLRDCIRKKALGKDNEVSNNPHEPTPDGSRVLGYHKGYAILGIFKVKEDDIHVCLGNIEDSCGAAGFAEGLSVTLMHEWAHVCCWGEGEGKGVPSGCRY
jgi:hypothetical protein